MKITSARTSFPSPQSTRASHCVLELDTDEGVTGIAVGPPSLQHTLSRLADEILIGADPRAVTALWQQLAQANSRSEGTLASTIAAIDIALWDLKSKANDEPLWRTLGALRPRVNVHLRAPAGDDELDAWCRACASASIRGAIIDASTDTAKDSQRLLKIRDALSSAGQDCALMLDGQERWTAKEAVLAIHAVEREVDLEWIAAPTTRTDFLGHKRIGDSIRSAVCAGGLLSSAAEFLPHLHHHALNVVQLDATRTGITAALQIANAAYGFELPIALTRSVGNIHAHLGAALPYCATLEFDTESIASDVRIENGWAIAGDRPGHGLALHGR